MIDYASVAVHSSSAVVAEATAVKRALQMAIDMGVSKIMVESDCQVLINTLELKKPSSDWRCDAVLNDICGLRSSLPDCRFFWVRRHANLAADWLTNFALKGMCSFDRVSGPPSPFPNLLSSDMAAFRSGIG